MKKLLLALSFLASVSTYSFADTIALWTFETTSNSITGTGTSLGSIAADVGNGTASGTHAGSATWSHPSGNGSPSSFSSTLWAPGDYYQFAVNTIGFTNISVSFDQVGSGTGPGRFNFQYSTDGIAFTTFGSIYNVTNAPSWSPSTVGSTAESYSFNLSAITSLSDFASVYFRLTDVNTTSANGGTVGTGGTSRVDNFLVTGTVVTVPEPSAFTFAALGLGLLGMQTLRRKR